MSRIKKYCHILKEVKQERVIKLSWVPADVTDKQIIEVLELFGTVTKPPTDSKFVIKDSALAREWLAAEVEI